MVLKSIFPVVKAIMNNKGNTLMEMLIIMLIILSCMCLALKKNISIESDHYNFLNEYLLTQSLAIKKRESIILNSNSEVSFNENGHVNKGGTYYFYRNKAIVHLGNGYITYE